MSFTPVAESMTSFRSEGKRLPICAIKKAGEKKNSNKQKIIQRGIMAWQSYDKYSLVVEHFHPEASCGHFKRLDSSSFVIVKIVPCRIPGGRLILSLTSFQLTKSEEATAPYLWSRYLSK